MRNHQKGRILHRGPWQIPYKAINVLCVDGVRRTVRLHGEPDTFFSVPGSVQVRGKTVSGFVTSDNGDLKFIAYTYGKNADVLKEGK